MEEGDLCALTVDSLAPQIRKGREVPKFCSVPGNRPSEPRQHAVMSRKVESEPEVPCENQATGAQESRISCACRTKKYQQHDMFDFSALHTRSPVQREGVLRPCTCAMPSLLEQGEEISPPNFEIKPSPGKLGPARDAPFQHVPFRFPEFFMQGVHYDKYVRGLGKRGVGGPRTQEQECLE